MKPANRKINEVDSFTITGDASKDWTEKSLQSSVWIQMGDKDKELVWWISYLADKEQKHLTPIPTPFLFAFLDLFTNIIFSPTRTIWGLQIVKERGLMEGNRRRNLIKVLLKFGIRSGQFKQMVLEVWGNFGFNLNERNESSAWHTTWADFLELKGTAWGHHRNEQSCNKFRNMI